MAAEANQCMAQVAQLQKEQPGLEQRYASDLEEATAAFLQQEFDLSVQLKKATEALQSAQRQSEKEQARLQELQSNIDRITEETKILRSTFAAVQNSLE